MSLHTNIAGQLTIVKDYPWWADGVTPTRQLTPLKMKFVSSEHESQTDTTESVGVVDSQFKSNVLFRYRPTETKAVKEV